MNRCSVCWLTNHLPVCSHRCRQLAATKRRLYVDRALLEKKVVAAVGDLSPKATECPGTLAEKLVHEFGQALDARDALACLREIYFSLRSHRKLRFYRKGIVIPLGKDDFRGPFRLGK